MVTPLLSLRGTMSKPTSDLIDIRSLRFQYPGTSEPILDIETFQMKAAEKIFLFGTSGSGKSTLLEILSGVLPAVAGEVYVCGQNLNVMTSAERDRFRAENMGYVFQSFNLIPYLNVRENILLPLRLNPKAHTRLLGQEPEDRVRFLCGQLGIEKLLRKNILELSVGQQQRVAVARALLTRPKLLLADEPTSALDFDHREKFLQLIFEIGVEEKLGVFFVSHDRSLKGLFDRALDLQDLQRKSPKGKIR